MPTLVALALAALIGSLAAGAAGIPRAASAHVALAAGMLPLTLGAGAYAFAALCGEDCEAVVLDLAAPNGQRTGEHMTWVRAGLTAPGVYRLKVGVERCPQASCRYVVRVYRAAGT